MKPKESISDKHWQLLKEIEQNGLDALKFQHILDDLERNDSPLMLEQLVEILYFCVKK
ncbi:hypothetical protein [Fictibacillus phosphorivorans]|uniref:hypothetical protein n=1 Tax=Fictibacillus phosphorivorans TaxID=1221500 RepID=UPI000B29024F|nr:hypothetical protein [Fictibacillus phosphorivorans]